MVDGAECPLHEKSVKTTATVPFSRDTVTQSFKKLAAKIALISHLQNCTYILQTGESKDELGLPVSLQPSIIIFF